MLYYKHLKLVASELGFENLSQQPKEKKLVEIQLKCNEVQLSISGGSLWVIISWSNAWMEF